MASRRHASMPRWPTRSASASRNPTPRWTSAAPTPPRSSRSSSGCSGACSSIRRRCRSRASAASSRTTSRPPSPSTARSGRWPRPRGRAARSTRFVGPAFVGGTHPLARVSGVTNGIVIQPPAKSRAGGSQCFIGPGAGPDVTAATLLDDVAELMAERRVRTPPRRKRRRRPTSVTRPHSAWFVRLDRPGARVRRRGSARLLRHLVTRLARRGDRTYVLTCSASYARVQSALDALQAATGVTAAAFPAVAGEDVRMLSVLKVGGSVLRDDASYAATAEFLQRRLARTPDERLVVIVSAAIRRDRRAARRGARPSRGEHQRQPRPRSAVVHGRAAIRRPARPASPAHRRQRASPSTSTRPVSSPSPRAQSSGRARHDGAAAAPAGGARRASRIVIVPGFLGVSAGGTITSLGRGGSDLTAVLLATAVRADACELIKDVPGYFTADPHRDAKARQIHDLSIDDALAHGRRAAAISCSAPRWPRPRRRACI